MNEQQLERDVQTFGAIAKLLEMQDLSGTLVQLHSYFTDELEKTDDELRAGEIIKFLIDLSEYILSWKEARYKLDKGFLRLCTKLLENREPAQGAHELDQNKVQDFFSQALQLEPAIARELANRMQEKSGEGNLPEMG